MSHSAPPVPLDASSPHPVFDSVARYFGVLGEPTRLRILHAVCQEEKCVNDIIKATGMAQANVSRHLGLMYQVGMLSRRREGTQVFYRVTDHLFVELCRSVTAQVLARTAPRPASPDEFHALGLAAQAHVTPANPKETASV
ncbi:ArsR/SmtB family transcription factor [Macromonas nakdongensis]|uniref:ArsR/SmtB family transcription factor n=1 Tax=Macromonas nakdongensis TaxID=1843082 RepID=UPI000C31F17B|nr:metalloregulator ArsR/SmtB family transcription factor [Macromonas nakdongensis]